MDGVAAAPYDASEGMAFLHPWMFRFGFPGSAETIWILPRGVPHDLPEYEPMEPLFPVHDVHTWAMLPQCERTLDELHGAAFGEPWRTDIALPLRVQVGRFQEAFERGELVAWCLRRTIVEQPAVLPHQPARPRPEQKVKTWIEIVLTDQEGNPVAGEAYRLTLPDGSTRSGTLDEQGFARMDGIDPGTCDVMFPKIDGREWSATGPSADGDLQEEGAPFVHVAAEGECMSSIARAFRFRSWRTIYDNAHNEELRQTVQDPNVLAPGKDRIIIDRYIRLEERSTARRHAFKVVVSPTRLRIRVEKMKPKRYVLDVDGTRFEAEFPSSGLIEHEIQPDAAGGRLVLYLGDDDSDPTIAWTLRLGALVPVEDLRGVKQRLNNLGFGAGIENSEPDEHLDPAIAAYQASTDKPSTGRLDEKLRNDLRRAHDEP